jgi:hypothetical protein
MAFDVNDFVQKIKPYGFQKPSKFLAVLYVPNGMTGEFDGSFSLKAIQQFEFWCSAVPFPGLDISTSPIRPFGYGPIEKRPYAAAFGECQLTINCDVKGMEWTFFKNWLSCVCNFDTNPVNGKGGVSFYSSNRTVSGGDYVYPYEVAYKVDYATSCDLVSFDDSGNPNLTLTLNECYPISLSNMRFDWSQGENISTFNVVLAYRDWFQTLQPAQESLGMPINNYNTTTE